MIIAQPCTRPGVGRLEHLRMRRPVFTLLLLSLIASACANTTSANSRTAAAFDPVGIYDVTAELTSAPDGQAAGQVQRGELVVTREDGKLAGSITAGGQTLTLQNVVLDGRNITGTAIAGPSLEATVALTFAPGGEVSGTIVIPDTIGVKVSGTRRN